MALVLFLKDRVCLICEKQHYVCGVLSAVEKAFCLAYNMCLSNVKQLPGWCVTVAHPVENIFRGVMAVPYPLESNMP